MSSDISRNQSSKYDKVDEIRIRLKCFFDQFLAHSGLKRRSGLSLILDT